MGIEIFKNKFEDLEGIWQFDENGIEFIYARDLQKILNYTDWRNFELVIDKAKISCKGNNINVLDHFVGVNKMVKIGSNAARELEDYKLTRYACYLTAQNGDSRKEEIAFAQNYFAVQTRNFELVMQRKDDYERVLERYELKEAERIFSEELYQRGVDDKGFARIRSKGDEVLFGSNTTKQMKEKLGIPEKYNNRPLADFLHPIAITAKKLATQMSNYNVKEKDLQGEENITEQHNQSNQLIRDALLKDNIFPENLMPQEDIKKVESRLNKDLKTITKNVNKL
ncbi:MAG: DNA damage-inducible protein D [Alphaproteobacteria bacterium]|nr:DNA damage-inducible protein D [Alphaproteobacteria bacterium]